MDSTGYVVATDEWFGYPSCGSIKKVVKNKDMDTVEVPHLSFAVAVAVAAWRST